MGMCRSKLFIVLSLIVCNFGSCRAGIQSILVHHGHDPFLERGKSEWGNIIIADNTELHPDCAQIHCEVREGLEAEDGEVTLTEPPLVHFRTRHCAHQESFLTCPKLGPAARRICRYYSQCFALKCMSNIDDFRKNSRKCSTNLLQIWTCGGKIEEDSHLSVLESRGGEMWRQVEACLPWSCLLWKDKQRRSTELWNLWVVLF